MKAQTIFLTILLLISFNTYSTPNQKLPKEGVGPWVVNVYYEDIRDFRRYIHFIGKEPWKLNKGKHFFTIDVENLHNYQELFEFGFKVEINHKLTERIELDKRLFEEEKQQNKNTKSFPQRSCIRTVAETFATMDSLVSSFPTLATIVDIGDSWEKTTPGGLPGFDLRVLKITNSAIAGPKPILYVNSSMHAREIVPAELNTRFAEYLLNNYGTDADATWIVDHREVHLLLQANPDGRLLNEQGNVHRKNTHDNQCNTGNIGVDINRNFGWMWAQGICSGQCSSTNVCDDTYRGTSAQSEPENQAIDSYIKTLFQDVRGENLNDAAPDTTTGVYIDIHSVLGAILWPYGYSDPGASNIGQAPNHTQLQTLGRKFAWYSNYTPEQSFELYGADGASDDNAYGQLGVAAFTFELGGSYFNPQCSEVENIIPTNIQTLIYAAKVADTPYITASGPDIENLTLSASDVAAGTSITVTGIANDQHFNNANGTESTQNITSVEMFVDELPWDNSSTPILLNASDGSFNSKSEPFTGSVNTTGLSSGQHIIYLQTTDAAGVTGVPYAKYFTISDPNNFGTVTGVVRDALSNAAIPSVNITLGSQQTTSNGSGQYSFTINQGNYTLSSSHAGYANFSLNNINVTAQQTTTQDIIMQPICGLLDDNVDSYSSITQAVAAGWSHAAAQASNDDWNISNSGVSNSKAFSSSDVEFITDKYLISPALTLSTSSSLEFWHKYDLEAGSGNFYDGAVLEISTNNGSTWTDLSSHFMAGTSYDGSISTSYSNPLGGSNAWSGTQSSFVKAEVDLSSFAGQTAKIRWRMGTDSSQSAGTWEIDDIKVLDPSACVNPDIIFKFGFE